MATLSDAMLRPDVFPHVIADCQVLVDQEVSAKSGLSATAVKIAYKAVTSFAPGYYENALTRMVPLFVDRLEPYWTNFLASGGGHFGDYLARPGAQVPESVLSVPAPPASTPSQAVGLRAGHRG